MDLETLIQLDKEFLLSLNGSSSLFMDNLVLVLTSAVTWIPLYISLFYIVIRNNESMKQILLIICCAALCVLLSGTVDDMFVKPYVARFRPSHDPQIGLLVDIADGYRGGKYGFFSAHAANTFSIAVFFSLLVRNKIFSIMLIFWSLLNCWTRIYLGVHYPGDIICGLMWGGLTGLTVYYFAYFRVNRYISSGMKFISSQYTSRGYLNTDLDVAISVLMYTFIYALLRACF